MITALEEFHIQVKPNFVVNDEEENVVLNTSYELP
jgi:hypothetical protein